MPRTRAAKRGQQNTQRTSVRKRRINTRKSSTVPEGRKESNRICYHDIFVDISSDNCSDEEIIQVPTVSHPVRSSEQPVQLGESNNIEPHSTFVSESFGNDDVIISTLDTSKGEINPSGDSERNSDDECQIPVQSPPPLVCDDVFSDDSDEDLYECDFNSLKKVACNELKKVAKSQLQEVLVPVTDIDSDLELELSELPNTRVNNPRTSRRSKLIQAELEAARNKLLSQNYNTSMDLSVTDEVYIVEKVDEYIAVRVCWGTTYNRYTLSTIEPFANLYLKLSEEHNVDNNQIVLSLKGKIITPSDSIKSIGYSITDTIDGGTLQKLSDDIESMPLKVQCANMRDSVTINIGKFSKMQVLMTKYAKLKNCDVSKFTFHFDGERLSPKATPFSLDLEGDECIDAFECS